MNPRHLLEQADRLISEASGRPRQADLRRAVSTGYYGLFHLLTQTGGRLISTLPAFQSILARQFSHKDMKDASRPFAAGRVPESLKQILGQVPPDVTKVAAALIKLQEARHRADYDLTTGANFTKAETIQLLADTEAAFDAWDRIRADQAAECYLVAMLFHPLGR